MTDIEFFGPNFDPQGLRDDDLYHDDFEIKDYADIRGV